MVGDSWANDKEGRGSPARPWLLKQIKRLRKREEELDIRYLEDENGEVYAHYQGQRYHPFYDGCKLRRIIRGETSVHGEGM